MLVCHHILNPLVYILDFVNFQFACLLDLIACFVCFLLLCLFCFFLFFVCLFVCFFVGFCWFFLKVYATVMTRATCQRGVADTVKRRTVLRLN